MINGSNQFKLDVNVITALIEIYINKYVGTKNPFGNTYSPTVTLTTRMTVFT